MENDNQQQVINPGDDTSDTQPPQAAETQAAPAPLPNSPKTRKLNWKKLLVFLGAGLFIVILGLAIPVTRHKILGLFIKKDYSLSVVDSETGRPVSSAQATLGGTTKKTDAEGMAMFKEVSLGSQPVKIAKKYYKDYSGEVTISAFDKSGKTKVEFTASGRQVIISVNNKINGQALSEVSIRAADTEAKTDKDGQATIVLPAGAEKEEATFQLGGYNGLVSDIIVSQPSPNQNQFTLTPSGKVYFLSKQSGTIDIIKANLDGSGREIVMAGTGNEQDFNTELSVSRDWRYLALKARRETSKPKLYLLDTQAEEKLTIVEQGDSEIKVIGWSGHKLVYRVEKNVPPWQRGRHSLRYYDAKASKVVKVDESSAGGTDNFFSYFETIENIYALPEKIVYSKTWTSSNPSSITDEKSQIFMAGYDAGKPKVLKKFKAPKVSFINAVQYKPSGIYFAVNMSNGNTNFYDYKNKKLDRSDIDNNNFQRQYPAYRVSPDMSTTFWTESRDGQSVLFIGNEQAGEEVKIASLPGFQAFGWYTNDYILATNSGHELYVTAPDKDLDPVKIDNFHNATPEAPGQSYSYGGL